MQIDTLVLRATRRTLMDDGSWRIPCPCLIHAGDERLRLTVEQRPDGTIVLTCSGGCRPEDVAAALGLTAEEREAAP
jgi:hypothetical protein